MIAIPYILFALTLLGLLAVLAYWAKLKRKGKSILEDACHTSPKTLVKVYRLQKQYEAKALAKKMKAVKQESR